VRRILIVVLFSAVLLLPLRATAVVINEIAWMGSEDSFYDEWIELYNEKEFSLDLNGWQIIGKNKGPKVLLKGVISPHSFFILERTDDTTLPRVLANQIYKGSLNNQGEHLQLINKQGNVVDEVNCQKAWFAGDNKTKQTMERKDPDLPGSNSDSWQLSLDPGGTPKQKNSEGMLLNKKIGEISSSSLFGEAEGQEPLGEERSFNNFKFPLVFLTALFISFCAAAVVLLLKKHFLRLIFKRDQVKI